MAEADEIIVPPDPPAEEEQAIREGKPPAATRMQLNLTSMIDVIFQLLIYFVITATFTPEEGVITTKLPALMGQSKSAKPEPPKRPLNILVRSVGDRGGFSIQIEGMPQAPADFVMLADMLTRLRYDPEKGLNGPYKDDTPILIKPDATTRWQHVVNAFNAALKARYKNVSFARIDEPK